MSAINQVIAGLGDGVTAKFFSTGGTFYFTVPGGVFSLSALGIGGGGGGNDIRGGGGRGGCGGGASRRNNISVTPGEQLTVVVGLGGQRGIWPGGGSPGIAGTGGDTAILRGAEVLLKATGGGGAGSGNWFGGNYSGVGVGDVKAVGGQGGNPSGDEYRGGQGGGVGFVGDGTPGDAGVTAATNYRGGGAGAGIDIGDANYSFYPGLATSNNADGVTQLNFYYGAGGGGGAYGDAAYTSGLAGAGAAGTRGVALLVWGGRTFSSSSSY